MTSLNIFETPFTRENAVVRGVASKLRIENTLRAGPGYTDSNTVRESTKTVAETMLKFFSLSHDMYLDDTRV